MSSLTNQRDIDTTFKVKGSMSPGRFGSLFNDPNSLYATGQNHPLQTNKQTLMKT